MTNKMLVGKNKEGERFYLSLEIKKHEGEALTVNHDKVSGFDVLSISGEVIEPRKRNAYNFGQICDRLSEITEPASGLTLAGVARIAQIWQEWHLNDLQSHCAHQDQAIKWDQVQPCPLTGYKAGSAWLIKELPAEITAEIKNLFNEMADA